MEQASMAGRQGRDFRLLAVGQAFSWLGNGFQAVALAVAILLHGHSPGELGAVMASSVLALLAGSLFGGVWADRLQPRHLMIGSDLVRAVGVGAMAVMFAVSDGSVLALCALAALTSVANSFFGPAMMSLKPLIISAGGRRQANATLSLTQTSCSVAGPAAGGVVVAAFGAATGFAINAASFVISALSVALIRARVERAPKRRMLHELREGWREVRSRDWLLVGLFSATAYHVANGVVLVLIQVIAIRQLGGASAAGLIAAAEGLGGVLGTTIALRTRPRHPLRAGWTALLLMPVWVLVYVWPGVLAAVVVGAVIGYAGLLFFDVGWETALQDNVPHHALGRVASWDTLASFLGMPLGNALAGPLAGAFGLHAVLVGCACLLAAAALTPLLVSGTRSLVHTDGTDGSLGPIGSDGLGVAGDSSAIAPA